MKRLKDHRVRGRGGGLRGRGSGWRRRGRGTQNGGNLIFVPLNPLELLENSKNHKKYSHTTEKWDDNRFIFYINL